MNKILTVTIARDVIAYIDKIDKKFDSHKFIRGLLKKYPLIYAELLKSYKDVRTANAQIAIFLRDNARKIGIEKQSGKETSLDLFLENTPNTNWRII